MQTLDSIKEKLRGVIVEDLDANIDVRDLRDDVSLYDDGLGLDSIAIIQLIVLVEKKFDINFEEHEISSNVFASIDHLSRFISSKVNIEA
jgi:acyl carrier protein